MYSIWVFAAEPTPSGWYQFAGTFTAALIGAIIAIWVNKATLRTTWLRESKLKEWNEAVQWNLKRREYQIEKLLQLADSCLEVLDKTESMVAGEQVTKKEMGMAISKAVHLTHLIWNDEVKNRAINFLNAASLNLQALDAYERMGSKEETYEPLSFSRKYGDLSSLIAEDLYVLYEGGYRKRYGTDGMLRDESGQSVTLPQVPEPPPMFESFDAWKKRLLPRKKAT